MKYKLPSLKPTKLDQLVVREKYIKRCRYQKIKLALLQQTTNSQAKDVLMYLAAGWKWVMKYGSVNLPSDLHTNLYIKT
ncbi:MAG TPA: hypothetical protein VE956_12945 [Nodularia sp. (in: cyanobacteria)]|nr:hypothetical protein [Nodularia sp. (in: cyanobacteria)]